METKRKREVGGTQSKVKRVRLNRDDSTDGKELLSRLLIPFITHAQADGSVYHDDGLSDGRGAVSDDQILTPAVSKSTPMTNPSIADTAATSVSKRKRALKYICDWPDCAKAFDRPVRLTEHQRSHTGERPFVCPDVSCGKDFLKNEHLKHHIKTKHTEDSRDHVCDYTVVVDGVDQPCGKTFHTGTRLRRHMAVHEDKESTKCNEPGCGKVFRKQETLQKHIKVEHLGEKPYVCECLVGSEGAEDEGAERCGKGFNTIGLLRAHEGREHQGLRYFCSMCNITSAVPEGTGSDMDMEMDMAMDLQGLNQADSQQQVGFATYAELQAHNRKIHPPTCMQCQQVCDTARALKAHMEIEHSALEDRQKFFCNHPGCGRGFTKSGNLKVHFQTMHVQSKRFVCGEYDLSSSKRVTGWDGVGCGRALGTKANLEGHVRTQHLGLQHERKRIKSEAASVVSTQNDDDDKTMALLTGVGYETSRPIACVVHDCTKRFKREYDLEQHLELTHGWNVDNIAERDAQVQDGRFWLGGVAPSRDDDIEFERGLVAQLSLHQGEMEAQDLHDGVDAMVDTGDGVQSLAELSVLDPLLSAM